MFHSYVCIFKAKNCVIIAMQAYTHLLNNFFIFVMYNLINLNKFLFQFQ